MRSAAPQGFRRTVVLKSSLAERSSRDPALTNRPPNPGNSGSRSRTAICQDRASHSCDWTGRTMVVTLLGHEAHLEG